MSHRVVVVLAVIGFSIMMALSSELTSIAARAVMAAIAFGLGATAFICVAKSRAAHRRREQS